jgi:hypothetical protein
MPPKEVEPDLVSESSYNDIPLEQAICDCIKDLQQGLNNTQQSLLALIDHDEISHEEYGQSYFLVREFMDIAKELLDIVKSFKPKGFKAHKLTEDTIAKQTRMAD